MAIISMIQMVTFMKCEYSRLKSSSNYLNVEHEHKMLERIEKKASCRSHKFRLIILYKLYILQVKKKRMSLLVSVSIFSMLMPCTCNLDRQARNYA